MVADRLFNKGEMRKHFATDKWHEVVRDYGQFECEIGCHTMHHPDMRNRPEPQWSYETIDARDILASCFGYEVVSFAFPYGVTTVEFAGWLDKQKAFESLRLFRCPYGIDLPSLKRPDCITVESQTHGIFGNLDPAVFDPAHRPRVHVAGHSPEMLAFGEQRLADFVARGKDKGYQFVTVRDFYREPTE